MNGLKSWWNTRNIKPGDNLTDDQISELMQAIGFEAKIKTVLRLLWSTIIGICTIIAAVFSVLAFFK